jgi:TonB-linked SusC/RagA family outer membrane protein
MLNKLLLSLLLCLSTAALASAQVTLTGTVTDSETGEPLIGISIFLPELERGTSTDLDGVYLIPNVAEGSYSLRATFVGYQQYTTRIHVGSQDLVHNINLEQMIVGLDDIVVTAFGIQREARALGYGVSSVSSEQIQNRLEVDISRSLSGKMPGVRVQQVGGMTGSPTNITIRGFTSITGSNQPLFVVDGVRFDSQQNAEGGFGQGGQNLTRSNRFLDLDPNNIEDITVLKGLSATTLYGSEGKNGVILITTKSGSARTLDRPGWQVNLEQGIHATQISTRPDYQDEYGLGFDQQFGWFFSNWGPRFDSDDPTVFGTQFRGFDEDGTPLIQHPTQSSPIGRAGFPEFADVPYRYQPYGDPIAAFFRTGLQSNSSLNLSGGTEDLSLGLTFSHLNESGFTPGDELTRNNFSISARYRLNSRLNARTSFNLALTDRTNPPNSITTGSNPIGASPAIFSNVMYTPRSIDLANLPHTNPINNGPIFYRGNNDIQNPWWTVNNVSQSEDVARYFGLAEADLMLLDGLHLVYRMGYDNWTNEQEYRQNRGSVQIPSPDGLYETANLSFRSWDHNLNLLFDYQLTEDFHIGGLAGAQYVTTNWERTGVSSRNQIIYGIFSHGNFIDQAATTFFGDSQFHRVVDKQTAGLFFNTTLNFRDYIYLELGGRNDWFSTLEPENRSIFYPSASLSFIASDAFNITSRNLTYLKFYGGYGTSAGEPDPFSTRNVLGTTARAFLDRAGTVHTSNTTSNRLGNPNLRPELISEIDLGAEGRFWDNRAGVNVTVFHRDITDFLVDAPLDPSTGFTVTQVNVGKMEYQGMELSLDATPVISGNFQWRVDANLYADRSTVKELGAGLEQINLGGFSNLGSFIMPGEPFGVIMGTRVERLNGQMVVNSVGDYLQQDEIGIIGNPNPDYSLSVSNSLRYRRASLSFQFDYQHGGDIYSTWIGTLLGRGLTTSTSKVDRNNTFILPGVKEDGTPNDIQISASGMFFGNYGLVGPAELRVFDATHLRLSEIALSYELPVRVLDRLSLRQFTISFIANNMWMKAFHVPADSGFDPAVNSVTGTVNARGLEFITGPNVLRFVVSIRVGI